MSAKKTICCTVLLGLLFAADVRIQWRSLSVHAASLPKVVLSAESIAPRSIEQRTGEVVTHDYAQAWQDLAENLSSNRGDLLGDYFTGEAKTQFMKRIAEQKKNGLRTVYEDGGHEVKAVFYSPDGGEMQLEDRVHLGTRVYDGQKLIYSSDSTEKFLVLMTPGADRWYVRLLESVPAN